MTDRRGDLSSWINDMHEAAPFLADAVRRAVGVTANGELAAAVHGFHMSDPASTEFTAWILTEHAFSIVNATADGSTRVAMIGLGRIQRLVETSANGFVAATVETDVERTSAVVEPSPGGGPVTRTYPTGYSMGEPVDDTARVASLRAFVDAFRDQLS